MTLQVLWEMGEYATFLAKTDDVANLYADTIDDLSFDLLGSLIGAGIARFTAMSGRATGGAYTPVL